MDFASLLGKKLNHPVIQGLFDSLSRNPEVDDQGYCEIHDRGVELHFGKDGRLETVFLFHQGVTEGQHVQPFAGHLPKGLKFEMSQDQTRSLLGKPADSRSARECDGMTLLPFDKYLFDGWILHLTFTEGCSNIALVTVEQKRTQNQNIEHTR